MHLLLLALGKDTILFFDCCKGDKKVKATIPTSSRSSDFPLVVV
jgi:hypothetical protein